MPGLLLDQRLLLLLLSNSGPSRRQSTPGREWTEDLASCRVDDIPSQVQLLLLEARLWHVWSPEDFLLLPIFYIPGHSGRSRRPVSFPILSENVGAGRGREWELGVRMLGREEAGIGFMAAVLYGEGTGLRIWGIHQAAGLKFLFFGESVQHEARDEAHEPPVLQLLFISPWLLVT